MYIFSVPLLQLYQRFRGLSFECGNKSCVDKHHMSNYICQKYQMYGCCCSCTVNILMFKPLFLKKKKIQGLDISFRTIRLLHFTK